jgi:hypothetical protein
MKRTMFLAGVVAVVALVVGGIAWATCSAPDGRICLTSTYPLEVVVGEDSW